MQYKRHYLAHYFNLVEILTALAVIAIIIVSALSLLPKALQSNQEAINRMSAGDTGDQFLNFFASRLELNWDELDAFPEGRSNKFPDEDETKLLFSNYSMLPGSRLQIFYHQPLSETSQWDPTITNTGLFRTTFMNESNMVDFDGFVRCWKSTTPMATGENSPKHVRLFAEVSWPASRPMEFRRKSTFTLQVFRPSQQAQETSAASSLPCQSAWGIENNGTPELKYFTLSDDAKQFSVKEGDVIGLKGCQVDALTCAPGGNIFFINNHSTENGPALYRISRGNIDGKSTTPVHAIKVGPTGIPSSPDNQLSSLQFINNRLYAISATSKTVYEINYINGESEEVATLGVAGLFSAGGMTTGADGFVYISKSITTNSEVWRFNTFPNGSLTHVATIKGSGAITNIAAHPSGWLFLYDGSTCYKLEPLAGDYFPYVYFSSGITDMAFNYLHERNDCMLERSCERVGYLSGTAGVNPAGNSDFSFYMVCYNSEPKDLITRDDLKREPELYADKIFKVTMIRFKPKSSGKQRGMTLDGDPYQLDNSQTYTITSEIPFSVRLHKKNMNGIAMGLWKMDIIDAPMNTTIGFCENLGGNTVDGDDPDRSPWYRLSSGAIELLRDATLSFEVLGSDLRDGGVRLPITVTFSIDGQTHDPFGDNVNTGTRYTFSPPDHYLPGTKISITGISYKNGTPLLSLSSSPSNSNVFILFDGLAMPFSEEPASFLSSVENGGRVILADNQLLILYELDTTDPNQATYQDLAILVNMLPAVN